MDKRKVEGSQEDYCRGCILVPGCNVLLRPGESCGDRVSPAVPEDVLYSDYGCPNCLWAGVECHPEIGRAKLYREGTRKDTGKPFCVSYSYCD